MSIGCRKDTYGEEMIAGMTEESAVEVVAETVVEAMVGAMMASSCD